MEASMDHTSHPVPSSGHLAVTTPPPVTPTGAHKATTYVTLQPPNGPQGTSPPMRNCGTNQTLEPSLTKGLPADGPDLWRTRSNLAKGPNGRNKRSSSTLEKSVGNKEASTPAQGNDASCLSTTSSNVCTGCRGTKPLWLDEDVEAELEAGETKMAND
ncbi:unnamed protein product, partial [Cyprideis torosa]